MSVYLYDEAILKKLESWTDGTSVTVLGVEDTRRLFEVESDTHNDEPIKLPLLSLKRKSSFDILHTAKTPMASYGVTISASNEKSTKLNGVPISLSYQLDVYTRHAREAEEYVRNLLFNIIDYPKIFIEIPYEGVNYIHNSNMLLTGTVLDNSSDTMRLNFGQFTKLSIEFNVPDAYLWDVRTRKNKIIDLSGVIVESPTHTQVTPSGETLPVMDIVGSGLLIYDDFNDKFPTVEKLD